MSIFGAQTLSEMQTYRINLVVKAIDIRINCLFCSKLQLETEEWHQQLNLVPFFLKLRQI